MYGVFFWTFYIHYTAGRDNIIIIVAVSHIYTYRGRTRVRSSRARSLACLAEKERDDGLFIALHCLPITCRVPKDKTRRARIAVEIALERR